MAPNLIELAKTDKHAGHRTTALRAVTAPTLVLHGDEGPDNLARVRHGNAVMLTCRPFGPDGGEVVTIGTTDWVFGLADDPAVARVTSNVLDRIAG